MKATQSIASRLYDKSSGALPTPPLQESRTKAGLSPRLMALVRRSMEQAQQQEPHQAMQSALQHPVMQRALRYLIEQNDQYDRR